MLSLHIVTVRIRSLVLPPLLVFLLLLFPAPVPALLLDGGEFAVPVSPVVRDGAGAGEASLPSPPPFCPAVSLLQILPTQPQQLQCGMTEAPSSEAAVIEIEGLTGGKGEEEMEGIRQKIIEDTGEEDISANCQDDVITEEVVSQEEAEREVNKTLDGGAIEEEQKPYIVVATPVTGPTAPPILLATGAGLEEMEEVPEEEMEEGNAETGQGGEFIAGENAVEEELLEPAPPQDVIAPFSQWAEKKLEEQAAMKEAGKTESEAESGGEAGPGGGPGARQPSAPPPHNKLNGVKLTKNFASPDCSAKIVGANTESENSGSVISSSRDEYFKTKCSDQAWFVVELCESIKALKVQLANLELYSSSPHQFRVSVGSVYPGREKDWAEFGTFSYSNERTVQSFKSETGVVGKFAKVEILSHHGNEYFCPVSMFKVYGISEIDLITEDEPEDEEDPGDEAQDDEVRSHPIVNAIKNAVHKVVDVFRPINQSLAAAMNTSSLQGTSLRYKLRPEPGAGAGAGASDQDLVYYLLATQYAWLRDWTAALEPALPALCHQFGVALGEPGCRPGPWQLVRWARLVYGESFMVAVCNAASMERGQSKLVAELGNHTLPISHAPAGGERGGGAAEGGSGVVKQINSEPGPSPPSNNATSALLAEEREAGSGAEQEVAVGEPEPSTPSNGGGGSDGGVRSPARPPPISSPAPPNSGQTTWQKLSNRIKALERNVTLSTGFLEELSLKYIKQIEELNAAMKAAHESITTLTRREEAARERAEMQGQQTEQLRQSLAALHDRVDLLGGELLARHGLLLLLEVLVLGLVILMCGPATRPASPRSLETEHRRRSLDTIRDQRSTRQSTKPEKRRSSIEVGCLPNGQLGSMIGKEGLSLTTMLTRRQRKRKRRRDSKLGMREVVEELESDESYKYDTFHGQAGHSGREVEFSGRRRSRSWEEIPQEDTPASGRFLVGPAMVGPGFDSVFLPAKPLAGVLAGKARSGSGKTVRFPPEGGGRAVVPGTAGQVEVSNIFSLLDSSAHDVDSSTGEADWEASQGRRGPGPVGQRGVAARSKSSSPNRQANLAMRRQREAIRQYQPGQAEWLQRRPAPPPQLL